MEIISLYICNRNKSIPTSKMKRSGFTDTAIWMHNMDAN